MTQIVSQLRVAAAPTNVRAFLRDPRRMSAWVVETPEMLWSNAGVVNNGACTWHTTGRVTLSQHYAVQLDASIAIEVSEEGRGTQIVHRVEYDVLHPAQPLSRRLELLIQRTIMKNVRLNLFGAKALIERECNKDQHPKHHYVNFLPA